MTGFRPLDGVLVCDLSRLLPGPVATQILNELGARVIKIEEPGLGDYARWMAPDVDGHGHAFVAANRGKESVAVNLKTQAGVDVVKRLAARADVVVETFRPGVADRLGIGFDALAPVNPALVYLSLSGYGATGPMRDAPGHDLNYEALAGILHLQGRDADARPTLSAVPIADYAGAHYAVIGILAALIDRARTGRGRHLDVALSDAARAVNEISRVRARVEPDLTRGGLELGGVVPSYDVYATADGRWLALGALESKFWVAFCEVVERPDLEAHHLDPDIRGELDTLFATRTLDAWMDVLPQAGVPATPVLSPAEADAHPQARARPANPLAGRVDGAVPTLGGDADRVLTELGFTVAEIKGMRASGAIGE